MIGHAVLERRARYGGRKGNSARRKLGIRPSTSPLAFRAHLTLEALRPLHVFYLDGPEDWVVAYSVEDAWEVYLRASGGKREDYVDVDGDTFVQWDDAAPLKIMCDPDGHPSDSGAYQSLTCREWARREGRGILCSRNF